MRCSMRSHLLSTALRITGVLAILAACVVALLILAAPWGVYVMGLSNIDGRPTPLIGSPPTAEDDLLLRQIFRTSRPISVQPLSPWSYILDLVMSSSSSSSSVGADAAWLIARHYNSAHLKNRRSLWWQVSGAALTIWITRNWNSDQVVITAADLARGDLRRANEVHARQ
ncbi:MAG: hypothetical protein JWL65_6320 [Gammaproteobacteria bacterium]|nr:hypothetical protein [Gammaproteobacteria bacterium]